MPTTVDAATATRRCGAVMHCSSSLLAAHEAATVVWQAVSVLPAVSFLPGFITTWP